MNRARTILAAFAFSLSGCPAVQVLPDPLNAHRLAEEKCLKVLIHVGGEEYRKARVCYPAGSVIATQEAIRAVQPGP